MIKIITRKKCPCGGEFICVGNGFANSIGTTWDHQCDACKGYGRFQIQYPNEHLVFETDEIEEVWE